MMTTADRSAVRVTTLPGLRNRGKVRDIYELGDHLMIVATDRISAFDVVMNEPVPGKGVLLTQMSKFWLDTLPACRPHHLEYVVSRNRTPAGYESHSADLRDRAMVVKKTAVIPIECVVRGYVVGGGWKEYQSSGSISGVMLPPGLRFAEKLPTPIFTPSTKAASGHDEPVSFDEACNRLAAAPAEWLPASRQGASPREILGYAHEVLTDARARALAIYSQAAEHAARSGVIIADTKFEFGLLGEELLLIDEVLTPDSSRFWPAESYQVGSNPPSFDKQFLRDYLESIAWPKSPPPPAIPDAIIEQTRQRYLEAYERLAGKH